MPAEGVAWWCCFFKFGILIYVVFDSFGFADFFFVGSFATLKSVCGKMEDFEDGIRALAKTAEDFEDGDECDNACVPNAQSDRS